MKIIIFKDTGIVYKIINSTNGILTLALPVDNIIRAFTDEEEPKLTSGFYYLDTLDLNKEHRYLIINPNKFYHRMYDLL